MTVIAKRLSQIIILTNFVLGYEHDGIDTFSVRSFLEFMDSLIPRNSQKHYLFPNKVYGHLVENSRTQISVSFSENLPDTAGQSFLVTEDINYWHDKYHIIFAAPETIFNLESILNWVIDQFKQQSSSQRNGQLYIRWPNILPGADRIDQEIILLRNITKRITIHMEIFIVFPLNKGSFRVWEVYSVKSKEFMQEVRISSGFSRGIAFRRHNLQLAPVAGISVVDEEMGRMVKMEKVGSDLEFVSGILVDIFQDLRDSLNFTEIVVEGNDYISQDVNNSLTGIAKQILEDEADLAITMAFFLPYRARHLSFLQPVCAERIYIFFRQPSINSVRSIFLKPFSARLWQVLAITWMVIVVSLYFMSWLQKASNDKWIMDDAVLWAIGALCQQGWYMSPATTTMRIVALSGFVSFLVSICAYSAAVISFLAVERMPVTSVADLLKNDFYLLAEDNAHYDELLLKDFPPAKIKSLFRIIQDDKEAVKLALKGQHGVIFPKDAFYSYARALSNDRQLCETVSSVPLSQTRIYSGMFVKKGSPFKELFDYSLLIIFERGLITRYRTQMYEEANPKCLEKKLPKREILEFQDVFMAFVVLVVGYFISTMVLIIEIRVYRNSKAIRYLGNMVI